MRSQRRKIAGRRSWAEIERTLRSAVKGSRRFQVRLQYVKCCSSIETLVHETTTAYLLGTKCKVQLHSRIREMEGKGIQVQGLDWIYSKGDYCFGTVDQRTRGRACVAHVRNSDPTHRSRCMTNATATQFTDDTIRSPIHVS